MPAPPLAPRAFIFASLKQESLDFENLSIEPKQLQTSQKIEESSSQDRHTADMIMEALSEEEFSRAGTPRVHKPRASSPDDNNYYSSNISSIIKTAPNYSFAINSAN